MSYRNCCLFGSLLWVGLFSGLGFCQPTQLDSVFRFEQVVGVLGHVAELPNGDWLVNELV